MLVLNPAQVTFGLLTWKDVRSISVERLAKEEAVEWSDAGPHVVFADVVQTRVRIRVALEEVGEYTDTPRPGDSGVLAFEIGPGGTDARRRRVSATCVVLAVTRSVANHSAIRTIEFVGISSDGASDPVTITTMGGVP